MEDVWANLPENAKVGVLPQLIDIDDAQDLQTWRHRHHVEVDAHTEAQTHTAPANEPPGLISRLFKRT